MTASAKRRLSKFNFEGEGSHLALVGTAVGGPANGYDYALIQKATKDINESLVEKATQVSVTMNIVDFLCKFFDLWYEDAAVLALVMGYEINEDYSEEVTSTYSDYLEERVSAITIMKSVVLDAEDIGKAVSQLSPKDYLSILKAQDQFEKNYEAAVEKAASYKKASVDVTEELNVEKSTKSPSVENHDKGTEMSEFMTKAVHDAAVQEAVEKAKEQVQVELTKALGKIEEFEVAVKASVEKARKEAIASVEKDADKADELLKSLEAVSEEAFGVIIKSLQAKEDKLEESDLFVQKSKIVEEPEAEVSFAKYLPKKK